MSIREATADWMDISFYPPRYPALAVAPAPKPHSRIVTITPTPARTHIATSYHLKRAHVS